MADGITVATVHGDVPQLWMPVADRAGTVYLGEFEGASVWAVAPGDREVEAGVTMQGLRQVGPLLSTREANLALTAVGMLAWHRDYRFCPQCGSALDGEHHGWVLRCELGHPHFPRTDPAVIVAITDRDDRLLLAKNRRTRTQMVSVLAGFVEPGEDFESAIVREVFEEVGLVVEPGDYRASQPWPYPRSVMIGYRARVAEGVDPEHLRLQDDEIEHARWYTREEFHAAFRAGRVEIPDKASIARALIDEWAEPKGAEASEAASVAGTGTARAAGEGA